MTTEDLVVAAPPIVTTASSNHCSASESSTKIDEYGAATNSTRETSQNEHQQTEASITAAVEEDLLKVDVNEPNAKEVGIFFYFFN